MKTRSQLLIVALMFLLAAPLAAVVYDVPADQTLIDRSALVVRGRVIDVRARESVSGRIETVAVVEVSRVLKGSARVERVEVIQPGGALNGRFAMIAGAPEYRIGDENILFLVRDQNNGWATSDLGVGKFEIRTATDGHQYATRDITSVESLATGKRAPNRQAEAFEAAIANRAAGDVFSTSYLTDQPLTFVTQRNATEKRAIGKLGAGNYLQDLGGKPGKWFGASYTMKTTGSQPGHADPTGIAGDGAGAWNGASAGSVNIAVTTGGTPSGENGSNTIAFSGSPAAGVAFTWLYGDVGDANFNKILEADIAVSGQSFSHQVFTQIMAHEIGHSLGFRHSNEGTPSDSNAIMNSSVSGQYGANLQCWDKEALAAVYGGSSSCTNAPSITGHPQSDTITSGQSTSLSVSATNGCSFTYQWYKGNSGNTSQPVSGGTGSSLNTGSLNSTTSYWVAVTNGCGTSNSNTATITVQPPPNCNPVSISSQPQGAAIVQGQTHVLSVGVAAGATQPVSFQWFRDGNSIGGATGASFSATTAGTYFVRVSNSCGTADSQSAIVTVSAACVAPTVTSQPASRTVTNANAVQLTVIAGGSGPLTYQWFEGNSGDTSKPLNGATGPSASTGTITKTTSFWVQIKNSCGQVNSAAAVITFTPPCSAPAAFTVSGPGAVTSGVGYSVTWEAIAGVTNFELQESDNPQFTGVSNRTLTQPRFDTVKTVTVATKFYYRVRAFATCDGSASPFSTTLEVVVTPPASANSLDPTVSVPVGSTTPVSLNYFVAAPPNAKTAMDSTFTVSTDKSWASVTPTSGTIPPSGQNLVVTLNPSTLAAGTNTATVSVTTPTGAPIATTTVGVNLVTPVSPNPKPPSAAISKGLIIPVVGRAQGSNNSLFLSDVRLLNATSKPMKYVMTFTASGQNGLTSGRQMQIDIPVGETKALNDIVKNFFGLGNTGDSSVGVLDIRSATNDVLDPKTTFASSRTYNLTTGGTFGQYIPALSSPSFISKGQKLSLQQVAQSTQYRTNVGFVEGSGNFLTAVARVFNGAGAKLGEVPINLQPFEQRQFNSFISANAGISTLTDGRIEVEVTSELGSLAAYASVVDNRTNDPLLVSPTVIGAARSNKYVIPGIADLTNPNANWRSDIRVFNSGATTQPVTLTYYPQGGGSPVTKQVSIAANTILAVDGVLQSYFGLSNSGGALHISTPSESSLIASARTYDSKMNSEGQPLTYGQFIPAVTPAETVGVADRALQLLQVEESERFRSNLALTEVTGKTVTVRLTAYAPDQLAAPFKDVTLGANGFTQLNQVLKQMNFNTTYNARVSVKVIGGDGRVTAYASVVDNKTQDPTYIPAQ